MAPTDTREARFHRYYRSMHGRWTGRFLLEVTDPAALRARPMSVRDRFRIASMRFVQALTGPLTLDTSLDYTTAGAQGVAVHTTRISRWGLPLFRSLERLTLADGDRQVSIDGDQRYAPLFLAEPQRGAAEVHAEATGAVYDFPFPGGRMEQTAALEPDGALRLVQLTPWSRAEARLVRWSTASS